MKNKKRYNQKIIEKKWQKIWFEKKIYSTNNKKPKSYVLVELTYSSGDLHIGHWFAWSAPDVFARYKRMMGFNVLFPVGGFDSFGLPAENAAIKKNIHPKDWTMDNIENMRKQFATIGPSFDWEKEVITSDPSYYKWTQWLFLQLFNKGLAYRAKALSNWCPKCQTVLANEHVVNGCCWRHVDTVVEQKEVDQWFFRITKYADKLIWPKNPKVNWPDSIIEGHNKWIGKKEGINIKYEVEGMKNFIECWTSRPDTNFGATFVVLAPEHPLVLKITTKRNLESITKYIKSTINKTQRDRLVEAAEKTGVFTGSYVINQLNGEKLPIWVADFVIMGVGTGAVVGVPGHDKRDFEFAKKFNLPIKRVVIGSDRDESEISTIEQVQETEGKMINSSFLDGLDIHEATIQMMDYLVGKGWGKRKTYYHLRDWSISRQRYWGAPIPIIYCRNCWIKLDKSDKKRLNEGVNFAKLKAETYMIRTVPEKDLPVRLPYKVDYTPTGKAPLATSASFINTTCPECGSPALRESETMDTYVDSSWYFLRYPTPNSDKAAFDPKIINQWLPMDVYFGGSEHILGHTLYARFITKFLFDLGYLKFDEFAKKRFNHGIILGPDGYRMSKSRGNVVNPDLDVSKYGADAVRVYLCFMGPHQEGAPWNEKGIKGMSRFLNRVWNLFTNHKDLVLVRKDDAEDILTNQHKTIQKVTKDIEELRFNTAIASIMEFFNILVKKTNSEVRYVKNSIRCAEWDEALKTLALLLAPFAPHLTEEVWVNVLGQKFSIHNSKWPIFRPDLTIDKQINLIIEVDGKLRSSLLIDPEIAVVQSKVGDLLKKDKKIVKWLEGKKVKKIIFIPGKLLNFVTTHASR